MSTVIRYTVNGFPRFKMRVKRGTENALEELARKLEQRARVYAKGRHRSGRMDKGFKAWVTRGPNGARATLGNKQWYARMQSEGTSRGVTPARFFEKALADAVHGSLPTVRRHIGRETR